MGYTLLPTQTRIPIPRPPLPVDRFPSFIVITSPSVIVTTLTVDSWHESIVGRDLPSIRAANQLWDAIFR
jgi:hypothetical protein